MTEELHEAKVATSVDPKTGMTNIMKNFENSIPLSDEEFKDMIANSDTPDNFITNNIMGSFNDALGEHKDILEFTKLVNDYRYGKIDRIKFNQLPKNIRDIAISNIGKDPKALAAFTNTYVNDMIEDINQNASRKVFSHDIDTGEGKTYDDLYNEQFETYSISNTEEGESELYKTFIDALNFETLSKSCKTPLPRYRKLYKHIDRLEKTYEHIYSAKRTAMVSLSPTNIPYILDRHFVINGIEDFEFIHYELLELIFLQYVIDNNLKVSKLEDHMYMYMTVKSIYDLDYLDKSGEIYPKVFGKIKAMIEDISNIYDISTLK